MQVLTLDVPELGNRCHLVHDGARALPREGAGAVVRREGWATSLNPLVSFPFERITLRHDVAVCLPIPLTLLRPP